MNYLQQEKITCPYCGEVIEIIVDCWELPQEYTEDCQVCCRPMIIQALSGEAEHSPCEIIIRCEDDVGF